MLRSDAKTYIARALSGANDSERLAQAQDALFAAIEEWNLRHDWDFLLKDTSGGFTVAACTQTLGNTLTTTTTDGFAGVNVGQTATGATIGTVTVSAIVSTTVLTVSGGANAGPETVTFSADIPIVAGTDSYNLPSPVKRPYSARTITNPQPLEYRDQRLIDREFSDLSGQGTPAFWNIFNATSFGTSTQNGKIRLFPIPGGSDTLRVRYYQPIPEPSSDGTTLLLPDRYVYALLELGRYYYLRDLDSENPRTGEAKERGEMLLRKAIWEDMRGSGDADKRLIPQMDHLRTKTVDSFDDWVGIS